MTYTELTKAYNQTVHGTDGPVLIALNPLHKPLIAELFLSDMRHKPAKQQEEKRQMFMDSTWNLFKGALMVYRDAVPLNVARIWTKAAKLHEIRVDLNDV